MRPDADDDRMTLEDMEEIPSMSITERDRESPAFITVENEKGVIEHVQVIMMINGGVKVTYENRTKCNLSLIPRAHILCEIESGLTHSFIFQQDEIF